jgi:hypothetical protein
MLLAPAGDVGEGEYAMLATVESDDQPAFRKPAMSSLRERKFSECTTEDKTLDGTLADGNGRWCFWGRFGLFSNW